MAILECPRCGREHDVPVFVSSECGCGLRWIADEAKADKPWGRWIDEQGDEVPERE